MNDIQKILTELKIELKNIEKTKGNELKKLYELVNPTSELATTFEDLWIGGWGQDNYNNYRNPRRLNEGIEVNVEYFYDLISKKYKLNLDNIEQEIKLNIEPFKQFQKKLITELSLIRDNESYKNENEILNKIEDFSWGIDINEYIKYRRPNQIPVYDMRTLNRGLLTPPHIQASGYLVSLSTKSYSYIPFNELAFRLIRQIEIKFSTSNQENLFVDNENILNNIFDNFHSFCNQLKDRHNNRDTIFVKDEYDVQDLLHCILKLHYKDVREEEYTPSYGGSSTRMDFLLKNENVVIEVKKTRAKLNDKEVGEQLILDVAHYRNHPNCKSLKCFVYDPENRIKNPRGLENDINKLSDEKLNVELYIRP
jgi:hypothetical protein